MDNSPLFNLAVLNNVLQIFPLLIYNSKLTQIIEILHQFYSLIFLVQVSPFFLLKMTILLNKFPNFFLPNFSITFQFNLTLNFTSFFNINFSYIITVFFAYPFRTIPSASSFFEIFYSRNESNFKIKIFPNFFFFHFFPPFKSVFLISKFPVQIKGISSNFIPSNSTLDNSSIFLNLSDSNLIEFDWVATKNNQNN